MQTIFLSTFTCIGVAENFLWLFKLLKKSFACLDLFILATGQLSAEVIGPGGKIPVDILSKERGKIAVSFVPKAEGVLCKYLCLC